MISKIYNQIRKQFQNFDYSLTTVLGRIQAILIGAELNSNIKFYGKPHFVRASKSKIVIGQSCVFRSKSTSNLIGINRPCILSAHGSSTLTIGNKCGFSGTVIGCFEKITIEDNVQCGANSLITDSDWHLSDNRSGNPKPIHIHKNVWIGTNVIVMKGVSIGENSVIGAGSVVVKNIPANVIAAGNPCKTLKPLNS